MNPRGVNAWWAHVIADTGLPGAGVGAILKVERLDRYGQMQHTEITRVHVLIDGSPAVLNARHVEIIDSAHAKSLRTERKRAADRESPNWQGPTGR